MIEAKEKHKVVKFGLEGCIYVVVKSKSYENGTIPVI
jgi:hypothetical protein